MHLGVQNMVVCGGEICCDVSSTMILGGGCVSLFLCDRWKKDKMATVSPGYIQIRFVSGDSIFLREDPAIRSGQQDWLQHDQDS